MAVVSDLLETIQLIAAWPNIIYLRGSASIQVSAPTRVTLHLVLTGTTRVRAHNGCFDRTLEERQYLFVPAGIPHLIGSIASKPLALERHQSGDRIPVMRVGNGAPACTLISAELEIDQPRIDTIAKIMPEVKRHVPEGAPTIFTLPDMLSTLGLQQTTLIAGGRSLFHRAAEAMIVNAVRDRLTSGYATSAAIPDVRTPAVAAGLRLMYKQPEHPWNLKTLAAQAGASRSVFAEAFAEQIGVTPIAFLTRIRMLRAEALIRENRHALTTIAGLCGYRSETSFNRAFSTHAGVSPGAWRRAMRITSLR